MQLSRHRVLRYAACLGWALGMGAISCAKVEPAPGANQNGVHGGQGSADGGADIVTPADAADAVSTPEVAPPSLPPPSTCGDDVLQPGETCDDGNVLSGDGCSAGCF